MSQCEKIYEMIADLNGRCKESPESIERNIEGHIVIFVKFGLPSTLFIEIFVLPQIYPKKRNDQ